MTRPKDVTELFIRENLLVGENTPHAMHISPTFLDNTNSWNNVEKLKECYNTKFKLYEQIASCDDSMSIKQIAIEIKDLKMNIQELFNLKRSSDHFRFWEMPKCSCPKMDNAEHWGTAYKIYTQNCIVHGYKETDSFEGYQ